MKKRDIIFVCSVIALAGILYFINMWNSQAEGDKAVITVNGKEYGIYALNENQEIEIENAYGYNRIVICDGAVYMEHADCPDQYCVGQGRIHKQGQQLVCLPHKLVVEVQVSAETEQEIDVIAK